MIGQDGDQTFAADVHFPADYALYSACRCRGDRVAARDQERADPVCIGESRLFSVTRCNAVIANFVDERCVGAKRFVGRHAERFKLHLLCVGQNLCQSVLRLDHGKHAWAHFQEFKGDLPGCVSTRPLSRTLRLPETCLTNIVGKYGGDGLVQQARIVLAEMQTAAFMTL